MNTVYHRQVTTVLFAAAFAAMMLAQAPSARADAARPIPSLDPAVTVHFADLNPSTPEGVRALYDRIADAAQTVCGPSFSVWDGNAFRNWRTCYRATIDHTVRQINRPELTALHQKTLGRALGQVRPPSARPPQG